jgi:uncharacterized protein YbaR (Trm112 family)
MRTAGRAPTGERRTLGISLKAMSEAQKPPVIDADFLALLRCPACKSELVLRNDARMFCAQCRRSYPVRDEIPILLIDEAVIEPEGSE